MRTVLLQLADSGFPAGTFAHSGGLEALHQLGLLKGEAQLEGRLRELVWHTSYGALPFLNDAHGVSGVGRNTREPPFASSGVERQFVNSASGASASAGFVTSGPGALRLRSGRTGALGDLAQSCQGASVESIDVAAQVFLSNHVAQRASQAQGKAFLLAAEATFESAQITALRDVLPHSHLAVAFGAALATQSIPLDEVRQTFLFCAVRSALSAVVRLGVLGPLRAQALLHGLHPLFEEALAKTAGLRSDDAVSVSPWLETAQSAHDRLYSRLFQS